MIERSGTKQCILLLSFVFLFFNSILGRPFNQDNALGLDPNTIINTCDEDNSQNWFIYCSGRLLEAAMDLHLYNDSKTFVDKPMKQPATIVQEAFEARFPAGRTIQKAELQSFIDEYFDEEGHELQDCVLPDWVSNPPLLTNIKDSTLQKWALDIHGIWKKLCRSMNRDVAQRPDQYSLLFVPNQFVVPGGRFREFYYWDAYWIIKGLIASGMYQTTKDMIGNFVYMVEQHGFVPNGGRVYYLRRSQPPMLIPMVYEYLEATGDIDYVNMILPTLEKELNFWNENRQINVTLVGEQVQVYQYRTASNVPRPESYREDTVLVQNQTDPEKRRIYRNLASAAESGWDFSSRWFQDGRSLSSIDTVNVIPVDLNAFICGNLKKLGFLFEKAGNTGKSQQYQTQYEKFRVIFQNVFYLPQEGAWFDYNLRTGSHNTNFYASMAVPLFTGCYHSLDSLQTEKLYNRMANSGAFQFSGGVPTSLFDTTQQWDFPNGWSPLEHMIIEGLRRSSSSKMQEKAYELAENWILTNLFVYQKTDNHMWEKYIVNGSYPQIGSGGEYNVQDGFGWTNGVILDLLVTYSDRMLYPSLQGDQNNNRVDLSQTIPVPNQIDNNLITENARQSDFNNAASLTGSPKSEIILTSIILYRIILAFD
ncbi:hypothetical protein FO519_003250 [Halicephalobus sp. NKZ332]|nr:hypothetical protein FO519_003250 [Halicephalobus sp. NKZ332]